MKIFNLVILIALLSAFGVGIALEGQDSMIIDSAIDNASLIIEDITFYSPDIEGLPNSKGLFKMVESGVHFAGIVGLESMRLGIHFGKDNPEHFSPEFILKLVKFIIILTIVTLLIKPLFYLGIFLIMGLMWIIEFIKRKKHIKIK